MLVLPETCLVRTLPLKNWALIIRADTDTLSITIARGDFTVSPINNGDTDSPSVKEPRDSRDIRSETGESSEEESPIRNPRG